ncbi:MAG: hypothetical protein S0880_06735 [Actinomycetota bacterium]|nr:hypothetical protein [Actinomycetota bacterium]
MAERDHTRALVGRSAVGAGALGVAVQAPGTLDRAIDPIGALFLLAIVTFWLIPIGAVVTYARTPAIAAGFGATIALASTVLYHRASAAGETSAALLVVPVALVGFGLAAVFAERFVGTLRRR